MFFNPKKTVNGIISVDDNFATLVNISRTEADGNDATSQETIGELTFLFRFKVSQIKALEENALSVAITVKSSNKERPPIITKSNSTQISKKGVIDNILNYKTKVDNINQRDRENFVLRTVSDISSKINNQLLTALKSKQPIENTGIKKKKIILKKKSASVESDTLKFRVSPVIYKNQFENRDFSTLKGTVNKTTKHELKKLYHNHVFRKGKPVSDIALIQDRNYSIFEVTQGILKKNKITENAGDYSTDIVNSLIFSNQGRPSEDEEYVTTFENVIDEYVEVDTKVKFSQRQLFSQNGLYVKFDLLQTKFTNTGEKRTFVLETITKNFDIEKYLKIFFQTKDSPIVHATQTMDKVFLSIYNQKNKFIEAKIYKKTIKSGEISNFSQVSTISLANNETTKIAVGNLREDVSIYRVIPSSYYSGIGFEFSDVVIKNKNAYNRKLSIIPQLHPEGISIEIYRKDPLITTLGILLRDSTIKQQKFTQVQVLDCSENQEVLRTILTRLTPFHVYEICVNIGYDNAETIRSENSVYFEYLPHESETLKVQFVNSSANTSTVTASTKELDAKFIVNASIIQDQVGRFKNISETLSKTYDAATVEERQTIFDKMIMFDVMRYNKTDGDTAYLGIISNLENFVDSQRSDIFLAPKIEEGNEYRYVLTPLIRDPASLLESKKTLTDKETKKVYTFDPVRHLHPLKIKKGMSISKEFLEKSGKDEAVYGKIGSSFAIDFSYKTKFSSPQNFEAILLGTNKVYLKWQVQNNEDFDHFLIAKEFEKVRNIIGKSHSLSENLFYIHDITPNDIGSVQFILFPILKDYSVGEAVYSNNVLIENNL